MARGSPDFSEDLICSICLELFCRPVILECGHNFCRDCISQAWQGRAVCACPECREEFHEQRFIANRVLGNLAEKAQGCPAVQKAEQEIQEQLAQQGHLKAEDVPAPEATTTGTQRANEEKGCRGASVTSFGERSEWYFGPIGRAETEALVQGHLAGTFLVRDSSTCPGDYVLSVSENCKVRHYIIHSLPGKMTMGPMEFPDFASLLDFYTTHYLDTTTLKEPLFRTLSQDVDQAPPPERKVGLWVLTLYDFQDLAEDSLSFRAGEVLKVLKQTGKHWWVAQNRDGKQGLIPVPYVRKV